MSKRAKRWMDASARMGLEVPSPEADRCITAAAEADADATPLTDAEWRAVQVTQRPRGRPRTANPKQPISIRLDADVVRWFRDSGPGWQSRVNAVLRRHVARRGSGER